MRTTLTIDDDLAQALKQLCRERGSSFKSVVNDVLRRGLTTGEKPPAREPFRVPSARRGFRAGVDPLKLNQLADELESERFLAQSHGKSSGGVILPDINLLVYAYNQDAPLHDGAKAWWEACMSGTEPVGLAWVVLLGFVRLMSNRRVLHEPMPADEALDQCRAWLAQPNGRIVTPGPAHVDVLSSLLAGPSIGANLVTDAHLAALAIEHQAELHSNDSDFSRFSGLRWRNPVA